MKLIDNRITIGNNSVITAVQPAEPQRYHYIPKPTLIFHFHGEEKKNIPAAPLSKRKKSQSKFPKKKISHPTLYHPCTQRTFRTLRIKIREAPRAFEQPAKDFGESPRSARILVSRGPNYNATRCKIHTAHLRAAAKTAAERGNKREINI